MFLWKAPISLITIVIDRFRLIEGCGMQPFFYGLLRSEIVL